MKNKTIVLCVILLFTINILCSCISNTEIPGNDEKYAVQNSETNLDSVLQNKNFIFLGSSVTYGASAQNESFVDYLEKIDGIQVIKKEAVPGTTLVTQDSNSYIPRLKTITTNETIDCFVCQLSTNDAKTNYPLGTIDYNNYTTFDEATITGAIETIILYAQTTWHCPIVFYTNTKFESNKYQSMIASLYEIQEKWDIGILDLWNDEELNNVSNEEYCLYMADEIHPSRAGYKLWWLPKFEQYLSNYLS